MKKKLIIGNWKLNPATLGEAKRLAAKIDPKPRHTAVLCPPALFLSQVEYPRLGAQDCFWMSKGPYTGQVSPLQLKDLKIKYCLVGHSEKRLTGEDDGQVNEKIKALIAYGITPVLCVGYGTTVEQDDFAVIDILRHQLGMGLAEVEPAKVVVAYEPVWAISSGNPYATKKVATPEHAETIAIFIKTKFNVDKVIYGGSTNAQNTKGFLEQNNIDGVLPGGASLLPDEFNEMINIKL